MTRTQTDRKLQHHEVFSHFKPFRGEIPGGYDIDSFLGTINRQEFQGPVTRPEAVTLEEGFPKFDNEYFEWIDLLESVVEAKECYTMLELGAGYGRWSVRAGCAVRHYNSELPFRLIAVEAEPAHHAWMGLHFRDNAIDPDMHHLIHAAISNDPGEVLFCVGGPRGGSFDLEPNVWYGQSLTTNEDATSLSEPDGEYYGFKVTRRKSGWRSIRVPSVSLRSLLKDHQRVDLIDMDIEGQELPSIRTSIEELDAKVKRLHIGTHSKQIEASLRQLLSTHGWRSCLADYSLGLTNETPWGPIAFDNGVQSWVNPRLG